MNHHLIRRTCTVAAVFLITAAQAAIGEDGITADTILLGRSAGITGAQAIPVFENGAGAQLYFDQVNKHGGVHGRKIILKTVDDGYDVKRTVETVTRLIEQDKVFMLFLGRGTSNNEAAIPVFTAAKVPNFAPLSPATSMNKPFQKYIFNVRARGSTEIEKIVEQMVTLGMKKIAIVYADDGFGKDVMSGTELAMKKYNLAPVAKASFARTATQFDDQVKQIAQAEPQAVIIGAVAKPSAAFVRAARKAGITSQLFSLSNVSSEAYIKDLGPDAPGIGVAQVVPHPWSVATPIGKEFSQAVKENPQVPITHGSLEGYISAKVLVEALKRAGPQLTRAKLISTLESMTNYDVGGMNFSYSPEDHQGSNFVELTVINRDGKFVR
jgi:branched-chain amino acid transport system substrate-binding protein